MNLRARRFAAEWDQPWFGFWDRESDVLDREVTIEDHADPTWQPADKDALVAYLRACPAALVGQIPEQECRLCGRPIHPALYLSDGDRLWTDAAVHLVQYHEFVLPERFVAAIRQRGYVAPDAIDPEAADRLWPR